jgi:hypothetical protein
LTCAVAVSKGNVMAAASRARKAALGLCFMAAPQRDYPSRWMTLGAAWARF